MQTRRRAKRFPIATSLLFREHGGSEWYPASTVNLSHSGVLFQADGPLPGKGDTVDFVVTLPMSGIAPAPHVRCTGRVVRIGPDEVAGAGRGVAVTIDGYAFDDRLPE